METQHTAFRQFKSVFGIASIPNNDFGSLTPNKINTCSPWLESVWKHNAQLIAELVQYLGLHQYLGSKFRSKLTGFEIEVGLAGTEARCFNW